MKKYGIEEVTGWILRIGVAASAAILILGAALSIAHDHAGVGRMRQAGFDAHPAAIVRGVGKLSGRYVIELGIYLLVATPVARVAASMLLFFFSERDRLYAALTAAVLLMTAAGLLLIR